MVIASAQLASRDDLIVDKKIDGIEGGWAYCFPSTVLLYEDVLKQWLEWWIHHRLEHDES